MGYEREPWEEDDYSESWDVAANEEFAYILEFAGPDDHEIEKMAEQAEELAIGRSSCRLCFGFLDSGEDDVCEDCVLSADENTLDPKEEFGGKVLVSISGSEENSLNDLLDRVILIPKWSQEQIDELEMCARAGMDIARISRRIEADPPAIILQLVAGGLLHLEVLNRALLEYTKLQTIPVEDQDERS